MEKKVRKKVEKKVKKTVLKKCRGCIGDLNGGTKGPKKNISRWLRPKKKSQNENPQRWIDSQLNSASFKTDFKLKWQTNFSKNLIKITIFSSK